MEFPMAELLHLIEESIAHLQTARLAFPKIQLYPFGVFSRPNPVGTEGGDDITMLETT